VTAAELAKAFLEKAKQTPVTKTQREARLHRLNKTAGISVNTVTPLNQPPRVPRRAAAPVPTVVQPVVYVQAPSHKAAPPPIHVTVDATPRATRTRVVKTDEDGIATETITERIE
jgi:hypothetical protein